MAVVTATELASINGRWQLPLIGCDVRQCIVDYALTLILDRDGEGFEVRIGDRFTFQPAGGGAGVVMDADPEPTGLGPVLGLPRTSVTESAAFDGGRLTLSFADGSAIEVPPSEDYEAWEVTGPRGLRLICMPGGEFAVWNPDPAPGPPGP